jgi:hypothetical protein
MGDTERRTAGRVLDAPLEGAHYQAFKNPVFVLVSDEPEM